MQHPLVEHPADAHRPAVVDSADAVGVGHPHVAHELLAELLGAVEHLDAVHLHARLVDGEHENGEPPVLGDLPVGAGQAQPPVGPPGPGRPDLRAVEDPLLAVAHRGGEGAGHVRPAARLGEELHPELLALEDGGEVALLLLLGAEVEQHRGARRHRRRLDAGRVLAAPELLVEGPLVRRGEPLAAVLGGEADAGEARVEQHALQLALVGDRLQLLLVGEVGAQHPGGGLGVDRPEVGPDPVPGPEPEALDVLDVLDLLGGGHAASSSGASLRSTSQAASRWRWSAGVPYRARSTVSRRM